MAPLGEGISGFNHLLWLIQLAQITSTAISYQHRRDLLGPSQPITINGEQSLKRIDEAFEILGYRLLRIEDPAGRITSMHMAMPAHITPGFFPFIFKGLLLLIREERPCLI